jgi:gamma-glutamylcysteine synthetase
MKSSQVLARVAPLFARGWAATTRVGIEHELVASDADTGAAVPIDRVRAAIRDTAYAVHVGFEPGGQVELSLPHVAHPADLAGRLRAAVTALRGDCSRAGVLLHASPVDPRVARDVPLQLTSRRYVAMQRHFDSIGPAGRRMMRRTASTQVCLDWWPGAAGLEQWRLLHLAGPFLAAAFARSSGPGSRLATWLAVDPGRTAFDDRLLHGDDPVTAYADFAAAAKVFTRPGVIDDHLTTLFPPVRPRGSYLEVRFLDVQPVSAIESLVGVLAALLYDDDCRAAALRIVAREQRRLGERWRVAVVGDEATAAQGCELVGLGLAAARRAGFVPVPVEAGREGAA